MTDKIWGDNTELFRNSSVSVNRMSIKRGTTCSWHLHQTKYNLFHVISGRLKIITAEGEAVLGAGDTSNPVPPGMDHCFYGVEDTVAIEVMYVEYHNDDIQRHRTGFVVVGELSQTNEEGQPMGACRENCNIWRRIWWIIRCPHPLSCRKTELKETIRMLKDAWRCRSKRRYLWHDSVGVWFNRAVICIQGYHKDVRIINEDEVEGGVLHCFACERKINP